jgi:NADPH:quinone reductase-like Zn-dependent oxidoreductase
MAAALFGALARGTMTVDGVKSFPLAEAGAAQAELESRQATGPVILIP